MQGSRPSGAYSGELTKARGAQSCPPRALSLVVATAVQTNCNTRCLRNETDETQWEFRDGREQFQQGRYLKSASECQQLTLHEKTANLLDILLSLVQYDQVMLVV